MGNNGDESFTLEDFLTYASDKESRNEKYNNVKLNNNDIDFFLDQVTQRNSIKDFRLTFSRQVNTFSVTSSFNVENSRV